VKPPCGLIFPCAAARGGAKTEIRSSYIQNTPPRNTFQKIKVESLDVLRLGMVFPRENPSIFEGERKCPLGNAEVFVRKRRENKVFGTNLFSFVFGERLSVFLGLVGFFSMIDRKRP